MQPVSRTKTRSTLTALATTLVFGAITFVLWVGAQDVLGAYQGLVGTARRSWAGRNEAAVIGFMRAYRSAVTWLYDPANREIAEALLVANGYRDLHGSKFHYQYVHSTRAQNAVLVNGEGQIPHSVAAKGEIVRERFTSSSRPGS